MVALKQALNIEPCTTANDGKLSLRLNLTNSLSRLSHKIIGRVAFSNLPHIQQMMGNALLLFRTNLGRANIQATIDLLAVTADDLAIEALGYFNTQSRFSDRRRPHYHNYLGFHLFSLKKF